MAMTIYEDAYCEGFILGFVMTRLQNVAKYYNKTSDLDKIINGFFAKSCPNMPSDLIEKMLKSTEIEDKSEQDRYLEQVYDEYEEYIKSIPLYQYAKEEASKSLEIKRYKKVFSIINDYDKRSEDLDYNSESVIHILILVYSASFSSPSNIISLSDYDDTDSRIKAIDSLSSKVTEILNDSKSVDALAERLYDTQTNDYRTYKYKDYFIVIKDYNDFYIYKAEAVDCSRPWLTIYNDKHHYEYVKHPKRDKYNRIV
ncbi:hypothetical protein [Butyrivibrio fibrisolvens]|uniref:hypothetical protein n=1 Tax=Butyrivibrio fibrisolvens TaxID=831 RepID=UPI0003B385CF|nr:hypothetical protein [Butyrivibrio fibrisolvens]